MTGCRTGLTGLSGYDERGRGTESEREERLSHFLLRELMMREWLRERGREGSTCIKGEGYIRVSEVGKEGGCKGRKLALSHTDSESLWKRVKCST